MDWWAAYERNWQQGRDALRNGDIRAEQPPGTDNRGRWGVSVLLWPDPTTAGRLAAMANELAGILGPHCWPHDERSLHITVRALERYREPIAEGDEQLRLYRHALADAVVGSRPIQLDLVGLTLAPNGVLVCGVPVDDAAQELRKRLGKALASVGVRDLEADTQRDTWHATLAHYTGPPADTEALIRWVGDRRTRCLGRATLRTMALYRAGYDGRTVRIHPLATRQLRP